DGLLGVEGARPPIDPEEPLQLQIGLDLGYKPVRLGPGATVDSRIGGWAQLAARLNDDLSLFAQLPLTLHQTGNLSAFGTTQPAFGFSVGDIRIGFRHGFFRGPVDVAGQISLEAATAPAVDIAGGTRLDDGLGAPSLRGAVAVRYSPLLCRPPKRQGPEPGLEELVAQIAKERAARENAELAARLPRLLAGSELAAREA